MALPTEELLQPGFAIIPDLLGPDELKLRDRIPEHVCVLPRGGALLMRPLLLHASSPATGPGHRRVLHIEYASGPLPGGLKWRWT